MRDFALMGTLLISGIFASSAALAACDGGLGRGWSKGSGKGAFDMAAGDKTCLIDFPAFIDDAKKTKIAANELAMTRAPKSGKIGVSAKGIVYTPAAGFKGKDTFCIKNTTPKMPGKTLSGCV